jgi:hypothetical protein
MRRVAPLIIVAITISANARADDVLTSGAVPLSSDDSERRSSEKRWLAAGMRDVTSRQMER